MATAKTLEFTNSMNIITFAKENNAPKVQLINNPNEGGKLFVSFGGSLNAKVSEKVKQSKVLTADLVVSKCIDIAGKEKPFFMVHTSSEDNVQDTLTIS